MTKAEIVRRIARKSGVAQRVAAAVVEELMEQVREALAADEVVNLRGFGSFRRRRRAAKVARDIAKNRPVQVPARDVPTFRPAREFMERMGESPSSARCVVNRKK